MSNQGDNVVVQNFNSSSPPKVDIQISNDEKLNANMQQATEDHQTHPTQVLQQPQTQEQNKQKADFYIQKKEQQVNQPLQNQNPWLQQLNLNDKQKINPEPSQAVSWFQNQNPNGNQGNANVQQSEEEKLQQIKINQIYTQPNAEQQIKIEEQKKQQQNFDSNKANLTPKIIVSETDALKPTGHQIMGNASQNNREIKSDINQVGYHERQLQQIVNNNEQGRTDQATLEQKVDQQFQPQQLIESNVNNAQNNRQESQQLNFHGHIAQVPIVPQNEVRSQGQPPKHHEISRHKNQQDSNYDNKDIKEDINDDTEQIVQLQLKKTHSNPAEVEKEENEEKIKDDNGYNIEKNKMETQILKKQEKTAQISNVQNHQHSQNKVVQINNNQKSKHGDNKSGQFQQKQVYEVISSSSANLQIEANKKQIKNSWKDKQERNNGFQEQQQQQIQVQKEEIQERKNQSEYSRRILGDSFKGKPRKSQIMDTHAKTCGCLIM